MTYKNRNDSGASLLVGLGQGYSLRKMRKNNFVIIFAQVILVVKPGCRLCDDARRICVDHKNFHGIGQNHQT